MLMMHQIVLIRHGLAFRYQHAIEKLVDPDYSFGRPEPNLKVSRVKSR